MSTIFFPEKRQQRTGSVTQAIIQEKVYTSSSSIHNCKSFYDYTRPWITHCSIQRQDLYKSSEMVNEWRIRYKNR